MESQLTIRLSEALHRRLKRVAKSLGRRSDLARLAVQRYLDEIGRIAAKLADIAAKYSDGPGAYVLLYLT